ncbi:phosphatase PAP2 family protein [Paenibacillus dendritiformis]|uniref:phosphatase PAP2 family protein n=1 Tax=Paenibacillus dendritiformis TaxID=130049 RepID=UPI00143D5861|nr:phosphatase PAP2 family protein [Paenibacillus dendritiformis]NKI23475.1 phosphatase PAP2 family protein [Paenibacillus dendritiformis]NRG01277.1 phosphatase PAP2 family protein [Paenibacillus dendritiformis]
MTSINQHSSNKSAAPSPQETAMFTLSLLWGGLAVLILIVLLFVLVRGVLADSFQQFDAAVTETVRLGASPGLTKAVALFTDLASSHGIIPISLLCAGICAWGFKRRWDALGLLAALGGSYTLNLIIKNLIQRTRPSWEHWVVESGYSFPSGHSMAAIAFYGMIGYLLWLHRKERGRPAAYILVLTGLLVLAIGLSRIYLGVHYATDVIAGFCAGGVWLIACICALQWIRRKRRA